MILSLSLSLSLSPGVLGNRGKGHLFQGNREQRPNFEGNRGTKTILGHREYMIIYLYKNRFSGNRGTSQFISREQRNRSPLRGFRSDNEFDAF